MNDIQMIKRINNVTGNKLEFRDAAPDDARFILSLRLDDTKNKYLHAVSNDIQAQRDYLLKYQNEHTSLYFIILDRFSKKEVGTVRLYDIKGNSFCWGSWILTQESPPKAAIESALMIYELALDHLGFTAVHFDVRTDNHHVIRFHERFGARRTGGNDLDTFYAMSEEEIRNSLYKLREFLPNGISVTFKAEAHV